MTQIQNYMDDGANYQAKAVLAYLQPRTIEESWDKNINQYKATPKVARWENCREQGYIVSLVVDGEQLNIAFFEHRNSDRIHAVKWQQFDINAITIGTAKFGDIYKDKWDTSFDVGYGEVVKMAEWIWKELEDFWNKHARP